MYNFWIKLEMKMEIILPDNLVEEHVKRNCSVIFSELSV